MTLSKLYKQPNFLILLCIISGILLGHFYPELALQMKPAGDAFIKLIRAIVPFIIFCTVVIGIVNLNNAKEAGRIGFKAILYFEVISTVAMLLGLLIANYFQPGANLNLDIRNLDTASIANYTAQTSTFSAVTLLLNIIPTTLFSAFTQGEPLQVLFVSILFGFALMKMKNQAQPVIKTIELFSRLLFLIVEWVMKLAPLGVFGAMSYTIGAHGLHSLVSLGKLLLCYYLTCLLFVWIILGSVSSLFNFSLLALIKHLKEELLIVLGTATTETVLPRMINKLERAGCSKAVAGFVLPAGYAFNLDGMCIYLTMAFLFIAQAFNLHLGIQQQFMIVLMLMFISKGAANVTGGGFIALATAIISMHAVPVEGLVVLLGIDRFMSEARSLTNLLGNAVATLVVSIWEGESVSLPSMEKDNYLPNEAL